MLPNSPENTPAGGDRRARPRIDLAASTGDVCAAAASEIQFEGQLEANAEYTGAACVVGSADICTGAVVASDDNVCRHSATRPVDELSGFERDLNSGIAQPGSRATVIDQSTRRNK